MKQLSEAAQVAKAIRQLAKQYGVKLKSCTSENYAGGNCVNVRYKQNQDPEAVKKLELAAKDYKDGHFNAMIDMYEYKKDNSDLPRAKYIFIQEEYIY